MYFHFIEHTEKYVTVRSHQLEIIFWCVFYSLIFMQRKKTVEIKPLREFSYFCFSPCKTQVELNGIYVLKLTAHRVS